MSDPNARLAVLNDPEFKRLARTRNVISLILTVLTLIVYYGFIFLIAFNRDAFAIRFTERVTLGIPIGVGVILASALFTGIYVLWANRKYDQMVQHLKSKVEGK